MLIQIKFIVFPFRWRDEIQWNDIEFIKLKIIILDIIIDDNTEFPNQSEKLFELQNTTNYSASLIIFVQSSPY